jgi:cold shock CspA family protein
MIGTIKFFDPRLGFGAIISNNLEPIEYFFSRSDARQDFAEGARVTFDPLPRDPAYRERRKRPVAVNVRAVQS